jgi:hypothetical protein
MRSSRSALVALASAALVVTGGDYVVKALAVRRSGSASVNSR